MKSLSKMKKYIISDFIEFAAIRLIAIGAGGIVGMILHEIGKQ